MGWDKKCGVYIGLRSGDLYSNDVGEENNMGNISPIVAF